MTSWPHLDRIARERQQARTWIDSLDSATRAMWLDAHVLGDFDWRDWFPHHRPSRTFINEAFQHAQYREETQE
jgi:hypothetical protein